MKEPGLPSCLQGYLPDRGGPCEFLIYRLREESDCRAFLLSPDVEQFFPETLQITLRRSLRRFGTDSTGQLTESRSGFGSRVHFADNFLFSDRVYHLTIFRDRPEVID